MTTTVAVAPHPHPVRTLLVVGLLAAVALGVLYAVLPVDVLVGRNWWAVVLVLVVLLGLILWSFLQGLARLTRAEYPVAFAAVLVGLLVEAYVLSFSLGYLTLATIGDSGGFNGLVTKLDAVYFATTVFTTVGFGDVTPAGQLARGVVTFQQLLNLLVIGVLVRITAQVVVAGSQGRLRERANAIVSRASGEPPADARS